MVTNEQYSTALKIIIEYSQQELKRLAIENAESMRRLDKMNLIKERVERLIIDHDLRKKTRVRNIVTIRQSIMWWLRENTDLTFAQISTLVMPEEAKESTRHANAIHAYRLCSNVTKSIDPILYDAVTFVCNKMAGLEIKEN